MSRLAELLQQRRLRPHWRDMTVADLVDAVKLEVETNPTAHLIDWEQSFLSFLRKQDQFLHELDLNGLPVNATKRAIAQAVVEGLQVPPKLVVWLCNEILRPARAKPGPKSKHLRDHDILETAVQN